jgi:hypothetical protein
MGAQAVGEAFDQRGPLARAGPVSRELYRGIDGEYVVAVNADSGETVREGLFREGFARALFRPGEGNRPMVVLGVDDHSRLPHPGEVAGFVELALRAGSLAHEGDRDPVISLVPLGPRQSDRVEHLASDRDGDGHHVVGVHRHVVGPLVSVPVEEVLLQADPPGEHSAQLPESRDEPVVRPYRHERAH